MRISIIGHVGSGKSTLAERISKKFNIPHLHLDKIWFEARGHMVKSDEIEEIERVRKYLREKVEPFVQQDSWVSDGWYGHVQPIIADRADQIVFLDISLARRLLNHLKRTFFRKGRHAEVSFLDDLTFTYQLIKRTYARDAKMREFAQKYADKILILRNYKEVEWYFRSL